MRNDKLLEEDALTTILMEDADQDDDELDAIFDMDSAGEDDENDYSDVDDVDIDDLLAGEDDDDDAEEGDEYDYSLDGQEE